MRCGVHWRVDLQVELWAEDQGSAILALIQPNKGNDSSTGVTYKLAVQGTNEAVSSAVCRNCSSSKRILQMKYISMLDPGGRMQLQTIVARRGFGRIPTLSRPIVVF